jgi:hypothetical protein
VAQRPECPDSESDTDVSSVSSVGTADLTDFAGDNTAASETESDSDADVASSTPTNAQGRPTIFDFFYWISHHLISQPVLVTPPPGPNKRPVNHGLLVLN